MNLQITGLDTLISKMESYSQSIPSRIKTFLDRLSVIGLQIASAEYANAQYDGDNDVTVSAYFESDNRVVVSANGQAVLFIEFGTGITYSEEHPKASELGMVRGSYGQGKGSNESWTYYGSEGTNGVVIRESDKGNVVRTRGNPPSNAMYKASKEMLNEIENIAKEVLFL